MHHSSPFGNTSQNTKRANQITLQFKPLSQRELRITERKTQRKRDRQTDKQTDRQTDRQTNRHPSESIL